MAYSALYRRFRPERFGDIIGQSHITTILLNQLRSGRVAHAYMFCGSRGTGKTSTARILARAVNCLDLQDGEPCGKCAACTASGNVDIIEMDAASNSGVDEMRALIERAEYAPLTLKKKVYIIDEAHMLTKYASNALLKTLEEPPEHVVFILATTEPQALPATIVSRCQRFEFHRLRVNEMVASMKKSLASIDAHIDEEGLIAIARAAEGGMRDCLSIADQCLSFCGGDVSADDVRSVLGSVNSDFLARAADAVISSDARAVLSFVGEVVASGRDLGVFALDLASHFRALLLTKLCGDCRDILDCTEETMEDLKKQAERVSKERAERAVEELMKLQMNLKLVAAPRTLLESTLLRICRPEDSSSVVAIADRVAGLEHKLEAVSSELASQVAAAVLEHGPFIPPETSRDVPPEDDYETVPDVTLDADELYKKLTDALSDVNMPLSCALKSSSAHWTEEGVLHIAFDLANENLYNYANEAEAKRTVDETAKRTIRPLRVSIDLKRRNIRQNTAFEIFGVPIVEE